MRSRLTVSAAGLLSIVVYLALSLVAYAYYPSSFSPESNWLSDLGDRILNPRGAVYYRAAAILAGVLLVVFFLGLGASQRRLGGKRAVFMTVAEVFGLVAALALIATGVFPEDVGKAHSASSVALYISFGAAVWFVGWALVRGAPRMRKLGGLAFCVAAATWAFAVLPRAHWLEWVAVFLLLLFVGVVSVVMAREPPAMQATSEDAAG